MNVISLLGDKLAKLLDLLNLAGDLGGKGLLEGLCRSLCQTVFVIGGSTRQRRRHFSTYSRLGRVGPGASEGGLPERSGRGGHGRAQCRRANSDRGHCDCGMRGVGMGSVVVMERLLDRKSSEGDGAPALPRYLVGFRNAQARTSHLLKLQLLRSPR